MSDIEINARINELERKVRCQQKQINILISRAQEFVIDLGEGELAALADLAENLKKEGIELNV